MSAEETLKKITEAARNLEIEKNDKRSRALAQAFYEKRNRKKQFVLHCIF